MKITIEPTEGVIFGNPHRTVCISYPSDDVGLDDMIELMKSALFAMGFIFDGDLTISEEHDG